jgi:large subunit ribosomal protein L25
MKTVPFTAYPRTLTRRGGTRQIRVNHRVPAVLYGREIKPQNLEVEQVAFRNLINHSASENILLDLSLPEDSRPKRLVLVKEIQHHPLSGRLLHVDLHEVSETEKVTIMVPVEAVGESVGVKTDGGVLEHVLFKIKVRALPKDLPEVIEVDVTALKIGDSIHLGDIKAPEGVEIIGDKHISVISVAAPLTEAQEAALEAEAAAGAGEVEMLKEKKEEGEEGAAPAAGKGAPAAAGAAAAKGAAAPAKGAAAAPGAPAAGAAAPAKGAEKKPEKKK